MSFALKNIVLYRLGRRNLSVSPREYGSPIGNFLQTIRRGMNKHGHVPLNQQEPEHLRLLPIAAIGLPRLLRPHVAGWTEHVQALRRGHCERLE